MNRKQAEITYCKRYLLYLENEHIILYFWSSAALSAEIASRSDLALPAKKASIEVRRHAWKTYHQAWKVYYQYTAQT